MTSDTEAGEPHSLFISDLHLCSSRPGITRQFVSFLRQEAAQAEALYILGDLFEYWAGDDDLADVQHQEVIAALSRLATGGTRLFFMHGNRDFLLAENFARATGATLLNDPALHTLYGKRVLLTHGDTLCTGDVDYQAFRQQVREPSWQRQFLSQPLADRKAQIEALRRKSEQEKSRKTESIMDVDQAAVHGLIREHDYPELLIHGHTHRPAKHVVEVDGYICERWVLGDWYEQGSCLRCDTSGCSSHSC